MAKDTRSRLLSVAAELFTAQGYEATSLREIADRLEITKAALYYHFHSKEEILSALLEPYDDTLEELLRRLEGAEDLEEWAAALTWIIDEVLHLIDFFRLIDRNRHVVESVLETMHHVSADMHERVENAAHSIAGSLREEVRMVAALGAVTGFDDWAPTLLKDTDPELLRHELTEVVYDTLGLAMPPARPAATPSNGRG